MTTACDSCVPSNNRKKILFDKNVDHFAVCNPTKNPGDSLKCHGNCKGQSKAVKTKVDVFGPGMLFCYHLSFNI